MFDRFRMSGSAVGAARLLGLLGGLALTWACAAFGTMALIDKLFVNRCPAATKNGMGRVDNIHYAVIQYRISHGRCPTTRDNLINKYDRYVNPRSLVDPWGTSVAYWCHGEDVEVRSAGPDKLFNTADDITRGDVQATAQHQRAAGAEGEADDVGRPGAAWHTQQGHEHMDCDRQREEAAHRQP